MAAAAYQRAPTDNMENTRQTHDDPITGNEIIPTTHTQRFLMARKADRRFKSQNFQIHGHYKKNMELEKEDVLWHPEALPLLTREKILTIGIIKCERTFLSKTELERSYNKVKRGIIHPTGTRANYLQTWATYPGLAPTTGWLTFFSSLLILLLFPSPIIDELRGMLCFAPHWGRLKVLPRTTVIYSGQGGWENLRFSCVHYHLSFYYLPFYFSILSGTRPVRTDKSLFYFTRGRQFLELVTDNQYHGLWQIRHGFDNQRPSSLTKINLAASW